MEDKSVTEETNEEKDAGNEEIRNAEASVARAFWVVCGYSFVGFISLFYGILLQSVNMNGTFYDLFTGSSFGKVYIIIILITAFYNLLFCHAYASLYVKESNIDLVLYPKIGHWIETILIIIVATYFIPALVQNEHRVSTFLIMVSISVLWCLIIIFYRTFLAYCKRKGYRNPERTKYKLVIPCFLMIAVNIYVGSSLCEMWLGQVPYLITFLGLVVFLLFYCMVELIHCYCRKRWDRTSVCDYKAPYAYYVLLLVFAFVCIYLHHYNNNDLYYIPMRTLFLASFVAIYLAMFEGWYHMKDEENDALEKSVLGKGVEQILFYMPMVVFLLFPFQQFQLIFFISFIAGHLLTRACRKHYDGQMSEKASHIAVARATLGTLTLFCLILDKSVDLNVTDVIGNIVDIKNLERVSYGAAVVGAVAGAVKVVIDCPHFKDLKATAYENGKILAYAGIALVLGYAYPFINDIEPARIFLSIVGCFIFALFELYISYSEKMTAKVENGDETVQSN